MRDYQRFLGEKLAAIPLIDQTHTYVVIEEVKADTAVSLDYIDRLTAVPQAAARAESNSGTARRITSR